VTPCVFVPLSYGNLRQHSFIEIWKNMENYIREYKEEGQCPMCDPFLRKKLFDSANKKKTSLTRYDRSVLSN
jgi:MoaA/NifB/PqqE/SkfB family radical SAM enzyme